MLDHGFSWFSWFFMVFYGSWGYKLFGRSWNPQESPVTSSTPAITHWAIHPCPQRFTPGNPPQMAPFLEPPSIKSQKKTSKMGQDGKIISDI